MPHDDRPARLRLVRNAPATVGEVLRPESLAPVPEPPGSDDAPPPVPAPLPEPALPAAGASSLSYSALSQYGACGYRYYLERVLRLTAEDEPPGARGTGGLEGRTRGSIVHSLLEDLDFAAPSPPTDEAIAAAAALHGARVWPAATAEVRALVEAFAREPRVRAPRRRLGRAPRARLRLRARIGPRPRRRAAHHRRRRRPRDEGDRAVVVDYKTDRLPAAPASRSSWSATTASSAASTRWPSCGPARREVEVVHVFLERADEPVSAIYDAGRRRLARGRAARARRGHRRGPLPGLRRAAPRAVSDVPGAARAVRAPGGAHAARGPWSSGGGGVGNGGPARPAVTLRSISLLSSAPKRNAQFVSHSQSSRTITPPMAP